MKKPIVLFLIFICSTAHAETVRVYKDYDPPRIMYVVGGADAELEASKAGNKGAFIVIDSSSIPATSEDSPHEALVVKQGSLVIDQAKKKAINDRQAKKESDKQSAIEKLKAVGMTDDEILALKIGVN